MVDLGTTREVSGIRINSNRTTMEWFEIYVGDDGSNEGRNNLRCGVGHKLTYDSSSLSFRPPNDWHPVVCHGEGRFVSFHQSSDSHDLTLCEVEVLSMTGEGWTPVATGRLNHTFGRGENIAWEDVGIIPAVTRFVKFTALSHYMNLAGLARFQVWVCVCVC